MNSLYHLNKLCLYFTEGRTLSNLPLRDIKVCDDQSVVFPGGTTVRYGLSEADPFPQRKLILGGLRCLSTREVAPDTPEDPSRSAI